MLRIAGLLLIGGLSACTFHRSAEAPTDPNVITFEQIQAADEPTIYGVISKLHAEYLRDRGPVSGSSSARDVPVVFLNQQEYGAISTLSQFASRDIAEVHFIPWNEALTKFGRQYGGGVIQLITRVD
jgi:hypothetical protein